MAASATAPSRVDDRADEEHVPARAARPRVPGEERPRDEAPSDQTAIPAADL